jgi:hypothetical protein
VPTLSNLRKPQILLDAFRACGALFVKTGKATAFTSHILSSSRESLAREYVCILRLTLVCDQLTMPQGSLCKDSDDRFFLVLAGSLLQMIGLFHQQSDERLTSNLFHGMLVMVICLLSLRSWGINIKFAQIIKRSGFIPSNSSWQPPTINSTDPSSIDAAWRDWAKHENMKKSSLLSHRL